MVVIHQNQPGNQYRNYDWGDCSNC